MKPRMRLRYNVWSCVSWAPVYRAGYGYTPEKAYQDWLLNHFITENA